MSSQANTASADANTVTCHKCFGTGTIEAFLAVAAGKCFECNGTGEGSEAAAVHHVSNARLELAEAMQAADSNNATRATIYVKRALPSLFACGKDNARKLLNEVASGRYFDEADGGAWYQMGADAAANLRSEIVVLGYAYNAE